MMAASSAHPRTMQGSGWISELKAQPVGDIARALNLRSGRGGVGPCPACSAETRGNHERRAPITLYPETRRWKCYACSEGGDGPDLVAWALIGQKMGSERLDEIQSWAYARGFITKGPRDYTGPRATYRPPPPPKALPAAANYVPADELAALWDKASADADEVAAGWMRRRGWDPESVATLEEVRVLTVGASCPRWARCNRQSWAQSGHRLLMPLRDTRGAPRAFRARWCGAGAAPTPKSLAPAGATSRGLCLADLPTRMMLRGEPNRVERVLIVEGSPDWITWAVKLNGRMDGKTALIGIVEGSWSSAWAKAIPAGMPVIIRGHHDPDNKGQQIAAAVAASLKGRCPVRLLMVQGVCGG